MMTFCSHVYQGKRKKNVLLLSTLHADATIADNQKKTPEAVKCYNDTKYGVYVVVCVADVWLTLS